MVMLAFVAVFLLVALILVVVRPPMVLRTAKNGYESRLCTSSVVVWAALAALVAAGALLLGKCGA